MIRRDRLLNFGDNIIYQNDDYFSLSLDSLLLANFVTIKLSDKKIIDLCCGNAPIPMLLTFRTKAKIYGVELQREIFLLGYKSIMENKMDNQIVLSNSDVKGVCDNFDSEAFDVVTCNPPYFRYHEGSLVNENIIKTIARHEYRIDLETILKNSSFLLRSGGTFAMVHRPDRLMEILSLMEKYHLEPKRIQFVYPKNGKDCNMLLIEGKKNGSSGLKVLNPLIIHADDGSYNDDIRKMFGCDSDVAK